MARYLMSSRVGALKWLGALQLLHGLILGGITIVYFALDFDQTSDLLNRAAASYSVHILLTVPTALLALGAGVAGSSMSRYRGLIHNISAKNTAVAASFMNGFAALTTITYSSTFIFYDISERDILDDGKNWEKAVVALIVINIIVCFFDMLVAFAFVTLGCLWMPSEGNGERKPSFSRPPPHDPYMRGPPGPEVVDTFYRNAADARYAYPNGGYYPGAGAYPYPAAAAGYRTLPALKY